MDDATAARSRSLECDRLLSGGLCMAAATLAAGRHLPRIDALEPLFGRVAGTPLVAPLGAFAAMFTAVAAFMVASRTRIRPVAALALAFAALCGAAVVPFAHHAIGLFLHGITPAKAAAAAAFPLFGIVATIASARHSPDASHFRLSAGITLIALFMAAVDGDGIFACILAAMGVLFFALGNRSPAR